MSDHKLYHYFHCYAGGNWQEPVAEHFTALAESGLDEALTEIRIGLIGPEKAREKVEDWLDENVERPQYWVIVRADEGAEQVTLREMKKEAELLGDAYILYTHTKGAWASTQPLTDQDRQDREPFNAAWRRSMTLDCVTRWRECVAALATHATVGSHIIPPSAGGPYYGGNFWWARAEHIRSLQPVREDGRHWAEGWIGTNPDAAMEEIRPGWPGWNTLAPGAVR